MLRLHHCEVEHNLIPRGCKVYTWNGAEPYGSACLLSVEKLHSEKWEHAETQETVKGDQIILWSLSIIKDLAKNPLANVGDIRDVGMTPGSGRAPGGGHSNPLQYSCLENPMDRGTRWATAHWVVKSRTWLKRLSKQTMWSLEDISFFTKDTHVRQPLPRHAKWGASLEARV